MAVLQQQNVMGGEEELKKKQESLSQPQTFGTQSAQVGSATSPGQQPSGSGRFVNLQRYLTASGPKAGEEIAQKIQGKAEEKTGEAQKATSQADSIRQAVEATKSKLTGGGQPLAQMATSVASETAQPEAIEALKNKANDIGYYTGGQYKQEVGNLQQQFDPLAAQAATKVGAAQQYTQNLASEKGRYNLLQDIYKRPEYGAGQQRLDQLLLQQQQGQTGGLNTLQKQLQQGLAGTQETLKGVQGITGDTFNQALQAGDTSRKQIMDALTGGSASIEAQKEEQLRNEQAAANETYSKLYSLAKGEGNIDLSKDLAQKAGLLPILESYAMAQTGQTPGLSGMKNGPKLDGNTTEVKPLSANIYNLFNPDTFQTMFGQQANQLNINQMYNQNDVERYNLLNQLAGTGQTKQAGTINGYLDTSRFAKELENADKNFNEYAKSTDVVKSGNFGETHATAKANLSDYINSGQDISKLLPQEAQFREAGVQQLIKDMSNNNTYKAYTPEQLETIARQNQSAGLMGQVNALREQGLDQGGLEGHAGDWRLNYAARQNELQSQLQSLLQNSGYGRKLNII